MAALFVAALMLLASWRLLRDSGRVLLDIAPAGLPVNEIGTAMAAHRAWWRCTTSTSGR